MTPEVGDLIFQLRDMIVAAREAGLPCGIRTNEIRDFVRKNAHVGDFKSLAVTLIMLAEAGIGSDHDPLEEDPAEAWKNG